MCVFRQVCLTETALCLFLGAIYRFTYIDFLTYYYLIAQRYDAVKQVFICEILAKLLHTFDAVDGCVSPILISSS